MELRQKNLYMDMAMGTVMDMDMVMVMVMVMDTVMVKIMDLKVMDIIQKMKKKNQIY
jgi:hypothetical protein